MIKKMLAIADKYLPQIKFLIKKPDRCSLELIASRFYWVDRDGGESSDFVSFDDMKILVSSGILGDSPSEHMLLVTPVYMLAIGYDPREHLRNKYKPMGSEDGCWEFPGTMNLGSDLGSWDGYSKVW